MVPPRGFLFLCFVVVVLENAENWRCFVWKMTLNDAVGRQLTLSRFTKKSTVCILGAL